MDGPLQLDPAFTHVVEGADTLVLVGDTNSAVLEGGGVSGLIPLIDGRRDATQIVALMGDHPPELVHFALLRLYDAGVVQTADTELGAGEPPEAGLSEELHSEWSERGSGSTVLLSGLVDHPLLLSSDYLDPSLDQVVAFPEARIILARLGPNDVWLGPTVGEAPGACLNCLQARLRVNLTARALQHWSAASSEMVVRTLARPMPVEAFDTLARALRGRADTPAERSPTLQVYDFSESRSDHAVTRLPGCQVCGDEVSNPPGSELQLQPRHVVPGSAGGYRTVGPDETWRRFAPLISPLTGVVRRVERVRGPADDIIHVYTASHAGTYGATSVRSLKSDARDHSGGKGITDLDARVSALCESLERFSAVHRGTEPVRLARLSELGGEGIAPNAILGFSEAQFQARESWNAAQSGSFHIIPEPYRDELIGWAPVHRVGDGAERWVPAAMLYHGYSGPGVRYGRADSNGLAGGNCIEEAVLQGLLELIERDSVALWWYSRGRVPAFDLRSTTDTRVVRITDVYAGLGRRLWGLDLTSDLGVPCVAAVSSPHSDRRTGIIFGFGCHLDPQIALRRAVTEVSQMLPTVSRSRMEQRRQLLPEFADALEWWDYATVENQPYLEGRTDTAMRSAQYYTGDAETDLRSAVHVCVARVRSAGMDVLVHDLTRADVGYAVARVIVPGLRHFWRRLGPGRLHTVPRELGWVARELTEQDLNPVSLFV